MGGSARDLYLLSKPARGRQCWGMPKRRSVHPPPEPPDRGPLPGGTLGARIYNARLRKKLSKAELSRRLGLKTWHMLHWWESDKHKPGEKNIRLLATELDVTADELLGLAEGQEPDYAAWRAFKETPSYAELSEGQRRSLRIFDWPAGFQPTLESYRWLVEALKASEKA